MFDLFSFARKIYMYSWNLFLMELRVSCEFVAMILVQFLRQEINFGEGDDEGADYSEK